MAPPSGPATCTMGRLRTVSGSPPFAAPRLRNATGVKEELAEVEAEAWENLPFSCTGVGALAPAGVSS